MLENIMVIYGCEDNWNVHHHVTSIVTVITGTTSLSLLSPVFAGGDHHRDGKKCRNNEDNNCNDTENNQKIKDHSDKNDDGNVLMMYRLSATQFYHIWRHNWTGLVA
jgi:hypothetical protein